MAAYWQVLAGVLLAVVLGITLSKQGKDMTVLLTLGVCAMVVVAAAAFLEPVIRFLRSLHAVGQLDEKVLTVMLKAVGITLVSQIAVMICDDAGFGALGKAVKLLATAAVLYLSLPLMESLISLIQTMAGGL